MVRLIAEFDNLPVESIPLPRYTVFENASMTSKSFFLGLAINIRQLFVPKSKAANNGNPSVIIDGDCIDFDLFFCFPDIIRTYAYDFYPAISLI